MIELDPKKIDFDRFFDIWIRKTYPNMLITTTKRIADYFNVDIDDIKRIVIISPRTGKRLLFSRNSQNYFTNKNFILRFFDNNDYPLNLTLSKELVDLANKAIEKDMQEQEIKKQNKMLIDFIDKTLKELNDD